MMDALIFFINKVLVPGFVTGSSLTIDGGYLA